MAAPLLAARRAGTSYLRPVTGLSLSLAIEPTSQRARAGKTDKQAPSGPLNLELAWRLSRYGRLGGHRHCRQCGGAEKGGCFIYSGLIDQLAIVRVSCLVGCLVAYVHV